MESTDLQSIIGLTIQCAGICLVTILSFFLTRSIDRKFLNYWTAGWICLSVSLLSLAIGFRVASLQKVYYTVYLLGEYAFGYFFFAGCRNYASGARISRRHLVSLIPATVIAVGLATMIDDFNVMFIPHAGLLALLFASALHAIWPARRNKQASPGLRLVSVALVLLTLDFLHYMPVLAYVILQEVPLPVTYLKYTSIYDLILETMLGFGTLMLVMDDARQEVEATNRQLIAARDRLEVLARIDPLTEALNRHAFYSLLEKECSPPTAPVNGCVVVVDIDNLKPINDSLGHSAGDAAIREVARVIRSVIRADDLLFRWGGDEFLILLFSISEAEARNRTWELEAILARTLLPGATAPTPLIVSFGLASFASMNQIEEAIDSADSAMYACKQSRKMQEKLESS